MVAFISSLSVCRSGKTSIAQVLFNHLVPKPPFFVEPSYKLTKHKVE